METTQSAGGVIVNDHQEVVLVKNGPTFWGLPKGHVDPGEDALTAALREIREETGLADLTLVRPLGSYTRFRGIPDRDGDDMSEQKTIHMFLFTSSQESLRPEDPNNPEARWVPLKEATEMLTHAKDREFLRSVVPTLGASA